MNTPSKPARLQTMSGRVINLLNFSENDYAIQDIAWGLSHQCRFNGQTRQFYSVAAHSVSVADRLYENGNPDLALTGLLHDASEAYIGDLPSPVKWLMDEQAINTYRDIEDDLMVGILSKFRCPIQALSLEPVKEADHWALINEAKQLLNWPPHGLWVPDDTPITPLPLLGNSPAEDYEAFMDAFIAYAPDEYDFDAEQYASEASSRVSLSLAASGERGSA